MHVTCGYTHKHRFKNQTKTSGARFLETWNNQADDQAVPGGANTLGEGTETQKASQ